MRNNCLPLLCKVIFAGLFFLLFSYPWPAFSSAQQPLWIEADGQAALGDFDTPNEVKERALRDAQKNALEMAVGVFIYFSGHGAPDPATGEAYIVPYDGDPNYLQVTGYPLKRLYERLGKLKAKEIVVVLDSCFSGSDGRSVLAKGARPLVMMASTEALPSNMAVLTATQGSQISTSSSEKKHGVFTYYFLKAIKDGKRDLSEIYDTIKPQVEDEAKRLNVQQSPGINPDAEKLKGRFNLSR